MLHHFSQYQVETPVFEGPLDLLLHLIEREELDITKLALAQVTDHYLAYISTLKDLSPDEVSSFLVVAARLIQIKSETLLPRPPARLPGEEDLGEALARQLILYQRYKKVAEHLDQRQKANIHTYLHLNPVEFGEARFDLKGLGLPELLEAAISVYSRQGDHQIELGTVITPPKVTIRQKIKLIADLLQTNKKSTFKELLNTTRSRLDIVVTFLAMLELVKQHLISIYQEKPFAEIELIPSENWRETEEIELEFGE